MKVRIGFGLGVHTRVIDNGAYAHVVDELERLQFDSLWLSERLSTTAPDPLAAMAFGIGRTQTLKFGMSVMVLPGRNPVILAKSLATLALLSESTGTRSRLLPAFGMGAADGREHRAFGIDPSERAGRLDEALEVMRLCWTGQPFSYHGKFYDYDDILVRPAPKRMEVWLGGEAPSALRRTGRLADGWLPAFITPTMAVDGRAAIEAAAAEAGRAIEDDHFGVTIPYSLGPLPEASVALITKRHPDIDPSELIPVGWDALAAMIQRFVDVGTSKFVVVPIAEPDSPAAWTTHLEDAAAALLPLEK